MFNFYYEIWQPAVDYNNNIIDGYFISNKGNLRSFIKCKKAKTKKIICIETGKLYSSRFEAAKELCVNPDSVWLCCSGRHKKTRNGYSFRFA